MNRRRISSIHDLRDGGSSGERKEGVGTGKRERGRPITFSPLTPPVSPSLSLSFELRRDGRAAGQVDGARRGGEPVMQGATTRGASTVS